MKLQNIKRSAKKESTVEAQRRNSFFLEGLEDFLLESTSNWGLEGTLGVFQVRRGVCKECLQRYEDLAVWLWSPAFSGLLRNEAGGGSGPLRLSHMEPCGCITPKQKKKSSTVASWVCFLQMLSAVLHCICVFYSLLPHLLFSSEWVWISASPLSHTLLDLNSGGAYKENTPSQ